MGYRVCMQCHPDPCTALEILARRGKPGMVQEVQAWWRSCVWIDTRSLGELSPEERAAIELEENIRRKDLTPLERSKELVRRAARVAPVLSSTAEDKKPRGHQRHY